MHLRRLGAVAGLVVATAGCTSILGDFEVGSSDATTGDAADGPTGDSPMDGQPDATTGDGARPVDSGSDSSVGDARTDGGVPPADGASDGASDAGCAPGLTRCATGCIALDATTACGACANDCAAQLTNANVVGSSVGCAAGRCSYACTAGYADCSDSGTGCAINLADAAAHCGLCGHNCNRGSCVASTCGTYVVAQQPTTGMVAKLATDGTRVVWSDTGSSTIKQVPAAGGSAIALATTSTTSGQPTGELAMANSTVAFSYVSTSTVPSVGLATVDMADSGTSVIPGAAGISGVSLNAAATHVFFVNTTGTQSSLNDCPISGRAAGGPCVGIGDTGRFLAQTAADNAYLFFDLTGANTSQAGLYIETIGSTTPNIFTTDVAQSVAVDGSWAYWTELIDAGGPYTILRTSESNPGVVVQTVAASLASRAFATDGANVYYWTGSAVVSKPVAGGIQAILAPASAFSEIAVGGGLLVWTDQATIWGLVLPGP
jgi:hypothetical protein